MIRFWDLELDKELCHSDKLDSYPSALAFAPDSKKLFARDENRFSVWDVEDAMEMREHKHQDAGANGFVLSPDRKWSESISFKGQNGGANGFVLSPDGKTLAAITEEGKRVVVLGNDLGERFLFGQPSSPFTFTAVAFSPDGKLLAAGTSVGSVFLREAASGKELPAVEQPGKADIVQLAFTADGKELLALDRLQRMRAWEAARGTDSNAILRCRGTSSWPRSFRRIANSSLSRIVGISTTSTSCGFLTWPLERIICDSEDTTAACVPSPFPPTARPWLRRAGTA